MKKYNLGSGQDYKKGWINVDFDKFSGADIVADLDKEWFWGEKNSADFVYAESILEHLYNRIEFFQKLYCLLKLGGRAKIIVPYYKSAAAYSDFTHKAGGFHPKAIESIRGKFKIISTRLSRARFKKWDIREVIWIIEKK